MLDGQTQIGKRRQNRRQRSVKRRTELQRRADEAGRFRKFKVKAPCFSAVFYP